MNYMKLSMKFLAVLMILAGTAIIATAQEAAVPVQNDEQRLPRARPNLLRELGLTPEQLQQIQRINQERRPQMEAAGLRLREANRALDEAIYSDALNEADVEARLKDVQAAQANMAKVRFNSELAIRKVLTPDQLVRFRDLRRKFADARQDFRNERRQRRGLPPRRFNRPIRNQPN
jgi:Spy/CpxP family protein refolding chaperone